MIVKHRQLFYFVGDTPFKTLEEAQLADLRRLIFSGNAIPNGPIPNRDTLEEVLAVWLLANAAAIVDTLTTTPTSRAKARKTNGARKPRKRPVLQPAKIPEP